MDADKIAAIIHGQDMQGNQVEGVTVLAEDRGVGLASEAATGN